MMQCNTLVIPPPITVCMFTQPAGLPLLDQSSFHLYFLRKTHHLGLDWPADCAEAAATAAHNPPQASVSRSLHFPSLLFFLTSTFSPIFSPSLFAPLLLPVNRGVDNGRGSLLKHRRMTNRCMWRRKGCAVLLAKVAFAFVIHSANMHRGG